MLSGNFCGSKSRDWIFGGLNFGPGIFWGFVWSPNDFFGFWFLPPFDHPCHLKSPSPQGFCDSYYSNQIGCLKPFRNHLFPLLSIVITTHPPGHRKLLMSSSRPRAIMALERSPWGDPLLLVRDIASSRRSDSGVRHEVREREKHLPHPSLQCRRILGGRNLVRVRIVVAAIMVLSRAKTFTRPKKTPALQANHTPSLFFFLLTTLSPWKIKDTCFTACQYLVGVYKRSRLQDRSQFFFSFFFWTFHARTAKRTWSARYAQCLENKFCRL